MDLRHDAQERVDRINAFREQLAELERDQILVLSDEQRDLLSAHLENLQKQLATEYDVDVTTGQKQLSLAMKVVSALGGLALCISVFLFFYRFWGQISTPVQVAILVAAPLIGLAGMGFTAPRERARYFTALIGLVTMAAFILDLNVLGQLFNITPSPNAFLAWSAFALILAYTYRLPLLLAIGLAGATTWIGLSIAVWTGVYWSSGFDRPENFLIAAGAIVLVGVLWLDSEFSNTYRLAGWIILFLLLLELGASGNSYLPAELKTARVFYQLVSLAAAAGAIWLGIRRRWKGTVNTGAAFFTIYLIVRLTDWWWDWMPKYLFFLILGGIAVGLLMLFRKLRPLVEAA